MPPWLKPTPHGYTVGKGEEGRRESGGPVGAHSGVSEQGPESVWGFGVLGKVTYGTGA